MLDGIVVVLVQAFPDGGVPDLPAADHPELVESGSL
jgi:hypothetical protein